MINQQREWADRLDNQGRQIGRLEMQVQQLAAPQHDTSRHDAPEPDDVVTARVIATPVATPSSDEVEPEPVPAPVPTSERKSLWRKVFG